MEVTAVGAVHYIVITFQVGTREMKERPKVGKVPQAGEQESVMESGGAGVPYVPTADSSKDANAVEISTLAFYNKKVSGTWSRDEVYTYTRDNGTAYAGYLFTGTFDKNTDTYTLGIQHESRPTSISFDYKYFPVINDKCGLCQSI